MKTLMRNTLFAQESLRRKRQTYRRGSRKPMSYAPAVSSLGSRCCAGLCQVEGKPVRSPVIIRYRQRRTHRERWTEGTRSRFHSSSPSRHFKHMYFLIYRSILQKMNHSENTQSPTQPMIEQLTNVRWRWIPVQARIRDATFRKRAEWVRAGFPQLTGSTC